MFSEFDKTMMQRAIALAKRGEFTTSPNPNVGCVITKDGIIVGEGFHLRAGEPHAEVHALTMAAEQANGATAYVTLEPCSHYGRTPPCANALIAAGIKRVVVAMVDPNPLVAGQGIERLKNAGLAVAVGLCNEQAIVLNRGFIKRMQTKRPYVQLKLAASLDGKTALANGESKWITAKEARADVQVFRAKTSAILSTSSTVLADDPSLNVRYAELPPDVQPHYKQQQLRQPLRVILDSQGRVTDQAKLFSLPGPILLLTCNEQFRLPKANVEVVVMPQQQGKIDLHAVMALLGERGINTLWVEAGATLAASLITADLVDELVLYQAPKIMGADAKPLINLNGLTSMSQVTSYAIFELTQIGQDIRVILTPSGKTHK